MQDTHKAMSLRCAVCCACADPGLHLWFTGVRWPHPGVAHRRHTLHRRDGARLLCASCGRAQRRAVLVGGAHITRSTARAWASSAHLGLHGTHAEPAEQWVTHCKCSLHAWGRLLCMCCCWRLFSCAGLHDLPAGHDRVCSSSGKARAREHSTPGHWPLIVRGSAHRCFMSGLAVCVIWLGSIHGGDASEPHSRQLTETARCLLGLRLLQAVPTPAPPSTLRAPSALPWCLPATSASPSVTSLRSSLAVRWLPALPSSSTAGRQSAVQLLPGVAERATRATCD